MRDVAKTLSYSVQSARRFCRGKNRGRKVQTNNLSRNRLVEIRVCTYPVGKWTLGVAPNEIAILPIGDPPFMDDARANGSFAVNSRRLELHKQPAPGQMSAISRTAGLDYRRSPLIMDVGRFDAPTSNSRFSRCAQHNAAPAVNNCWPHTRAIVGTSYFTYGACNRSADLRCTAKIRVRNCRAR